MLRKIQSLILLATVLLGGVPSVWSQTPGRTVEERVTRLEEQAKRKDAVVSASILAAVICALWAQNTGRSAWLWFFTGLIFSVITLLVMLYKNAEDIRARRRSAGPPPPL